MAILGRGPVLGDQCHLHGRIPKIVLQKDYFVIIYTMELKPQRPDHEGARKLRYYRVKPCAAAEHFRFGEKKP